MATIIACYISIKVITYFKKDKLNDNNNENIIQ